MFIFYCVWICFSHRYYYIYFWERFLTALEPGAELSSVQWDPGPPYYSKREQCGASQLLYLKSFIDGQLLKNI